MALASSSLTMEFLFLLAFKEEREGRVSTNERKNRRNHSALSPPYPSEHIHTDLQGNGLVEKKVVLPAEILAASRRAGPRALVLQDEVRKKAFQGERKRGGAGGER